MTKFSAGCLKFRHATLNIIFTKKFLVKKLGNPPKYGHPAQNSNIYLLSQIQNFCTGIFLILIKSVVSSVVEDGEDYQFSWGRIIRCEEGQGILRLCGRK